jgi:predicted nucleotidyltransferase
MRKGINEFIKNFGDHINTVCKKYNINRLILFGSAINDIKKAKDYDFAVSGYPSGKFFEFYAKLDYPFDKTTDLVDIDLYKTENHPLADIIIEEGYRVQSAE